MRSYGSAVIIPRNPAELYFPASVVPRKIPPQSGPPHSPTAFVVTELPTALEKHARRLFSIYKLFYSTTAGLILISGISPHRRLRSPLLEDMILSRCSIVEYRAPCSKHIHCIDYTV